MKLRNIVSIFLLFCLSQKFIKSAELDQINKQLEKNYNLFIASKEGNLELVKKLINEKADVNVRFELNRSAIFFAIELENEEIFELLIKADANINIKDKFNLTPLHYAAMSDNIFMAELLLLKDANVNVKDNRGYTAAFMSKMFSYSQVAELIDDWKEYGEEYKKYRNDLIKYRLLIFELLVQEKEKFKNNKPENKLDLEKSSLMPVPKPIAVIITKFAMQDFPLLPFSEWCDTLKKTTNK